MRIGYGSTTMTANHALFRVNRELQKKLDEFTSEFRIGNEADGLPVSRADRIPERAHAPSGKQEQLTDS